MKDTINPDGRNHSMPRGVYGFFRDLEYLAGVESVNSGRFIPRNRVNGFEANIQFYDETSRTFRVRVGNRGFISYFGIRVSPDAKERVEEYIRNYGVNESASRGLQGDLSEVSQEDYYGLNQTALVGCLK